jgi:hypothetical protein
MTKPTLQRRCAAEQRKSIGGVLNVAALEIMTRDPPRLSARRRCVGCGRADRAAICRHCRHTDAVHGTHVLAPGDSCPDCGCEVLR